MKPKTDPDTGRTRAVLDKVEKKTLARAMDILLRFDDMERDAHNKATDLGGIAMTAAERLRHILAHFAVRFDSEPENPPDPV